MNSFEGWDDVVCITSSQIDGRLGTRVYDERSNVLKNHYKDNGKLKARLILFIKFWKAIKFSEKLYKL